MKITFTLGLIVILALCSACSEQADLIIYNRSGSEISIRGESNGDTIGVLPGTRGKIKYPGDVRAIQVLVGGEQKTFPLSHYPPREYRGKKYPYEVTVAFKEDGAIYVCHQGGQEASVQPKGFPITPTK